MEQNKLSCAKCGSGLLKLSDATKHECSKVRQCFYYFVSYKISWVGFIVLVGVAFSELNTLIKIIIYIGYWVLEDFIKVIVRKIDVNVLIPESEDKNV